MKQYIFLFVISVLLLGCNNRTDITNDVSENTISLRDKNTDGEKTTKTANSPVKFSANAKADKLLNERRIYLVDLTRSMQGFNGSEDIFDKVKDQLRTTIKSMNDTSSEVILIPFTDKPLEIYKEKIANKESILDYISNLTTKQGDTNILDAWKKGESQLDPSKINYMFMLTDGVHNNGEPIDSLYRALNTWYSKVNGKYQFAFYVLLSPAAKENEICRIIDSSKQIWLVPSMNIHTDFILGKMNLSVNIIDTNKVKLHLTCTNPEIFSQGFRFKISLPKNDFYQIENASESIDKNGDICFEIKKLKPQKDLPPSYRTKLHIEYNKEKYPLVFFTPEEYNLNIVNIGTRIMTIKQLVK